MYRCHHIISTNFSGYLKSYIILPSTIWGIARNALVDAGISNPHSIGIPILLTASLARGRTAVVGNGLAVWRGVEIEERTLLALFLLLYPTLMIVF